MAGIAVNAAYNNRRQRTGLDVKLGTTTLHTAAYTHDPAGRLQAVSSSDYSAAYTYQPNSTLWDTVTFKNGQNTRLVTTRHYDRLNRLTSIASVGGTSSMSPSHPAEDLPRVETRGTRRSEVFDQAQAGGRRVKGSLTGWNARDVSAVAQAKAIGGAGREAVSWRGKGAPPRPWLSCSTPWPLRQPADPATRIG